MSFEEKEVLNVLLTLIFCYQFVALSRHFVYSRLADLKKEAY